jgi:hypothetical protein
MDYKISKKFYLSIFSILLLSSNPSMHAFLSSYMQTISQKICSSFSLAKSWSSARLTEATLGVYLTIFQPTSQKNNQKVFTAPLIEKKTANQEQLAKNQLPIITYPIKESPKAFSISPKGFEKLGNNIRHFKNTRLEWLEERIAQEKERQYLTPQPTIQKEMGNQTEIHDHHDHLEVKDHLSSEIFEQKSEYTNSETIKELSDTNQINIQNQSPFHEIENPRTMQENSLDESSFYLFPTAEEALSDATDHINNQPSEIDLSTTVQHISGTLDCILHLFSKGVKLAQDALSQPSPQKIESEEDYFKIKKYDDVLQRAKNKFKGKNFLSASILISSLQSIYLSDIYLRALKNDFELSREMRKTIVCNTEKLSKGQDLKTARQAQEFLNFLALKP